MKQAIFEIILKPNSKINLLVLFLFFIACRKEKSIVIPNENNNTVANMNNILGNRTLPKIAVESNYLYFQNPNDFNETVMIVENMDENELLSWENLYSGFESMNSKFIKNLVSDTMHFWKLQYIDGLPKNANVKHSNEIRSSKFMYVKYYFNRSINQFKEYTNDGFDNEEFLLIKNINKDIFSCLVNPNGIVRIGDSIYQFKRNFTKSILASVPGKINKLINGNLNSNNGVVFSNPKSFFSISGTTNCDYPSYFYNNEWAETRSIDFSSNPKYKLVLKGYYSISSDYYCNALYNPSVKVIAESYRKRWFEVQWFEVPNYKSIEASYTVNHPSGLVSNEYSLTGTSALWQFKYSKSFPQINSQT